MIAHHLRWPKGHKGHSGWCVDKVCLEVTVWCDIPKMTDCADDSSLFIFHGVLCRRWQTVLMIVHCSSSMGYRMVVPELVVTIICAVQIFHGELPEMNSEDEHYCNDRISHWEPSFEDSMLIFHGELIAFSNADTEWIVECVWQPATNLEG